MVKAASVLFLGFVTGMGNVVAQVPVPHPDDDPPVVVRAYPQNIDDPELGGDFTIEVGQEISLDVRGLGVWLQKLSPKLADSDPIKKVIGPCLDTGGNIKVSEADWVQNVETAAMSLCLYIERRPFNDILPCKIEPHLSDPQRDASGCPVVTLKFHVRPGYLAFGVPDKTSFASKQWDGLITDLYGRMHWFKPAMTDLTVGLSEENGIPGPHLVSALNPGPEDHEPHGTTIRIRPYSSCLMAWAAILVGLGTILGVWLGCSSDLLRDTSAVPNPGGRFPFSLGRLQMAVWTCLVVGSYLFIWLSTGDYNRIEIQAVGLLGISAATGLGAFAVNRLTATGIAGSSLSPAELKASTVPALDGLIAAEEAALIALPVGDPGINKCETRLLELQQRKQYLKRPITQFITDILSEQNSISFHRFQLVVWTVVLAFIFVRTVFINLQMPVFDSTILILMGISGGTYIGFKWPSQ